MMKLKIGFVITCVIIVSFSLLFFLFQKYSLPKGYVVLRGIPKDGSVPEYFFDYYFCSLNYFSEERNWKIEKFYHAWKNELEYGIYETDWGLDSYISWYWLTKDGKIFLLTVDDEGFLKPKRYSFFEVTELEICYWDDKGQFIRTDSHIFQNRGLIFERELILKKTK